MSVFDYKHHGLGGLLLSLVSIKRDTAGQTLEYTK
jgi:hypothetical protein